MNHWARSVESRARAWQYLRDELAADVALVQEAVPPDHCEAVYKPVDPNNPRAKWGSAVVVLSSKYRLNPRTRRPLGSDASQGELLESHPGAAAVADVVEASSQVPRMVAVSFYGAWEYLPKDPEKPQKRQAIYSVAASHRTLSDLTPLLVWARRMPHKIPVLLAGDFNATTQIASENFWEVEREESSTLFDRVRALGLHDLVSRTKDSRARLENCSCESPGTCAHVRTYRHANRTDTRPTQLDYVFASERLLPQVETCTVWDKDGAWALSDHCPIIVDLGDS